LVCWVSATSTGPYSARSLAYAQAAPLAACPGIATQHSTFKVAQRGCVHGTTTQACRASCMKYPKKLSQKTANHTKKRGPKGCWAKCGLHSVADIIIVESKPSPSGVAKVRSCNHVPAATSNSHAPVNENQSLLVGGCHDSPHH
jgi:hypothetical protein